MPAESPLDSLRLSQVLSSALVPLCLDEIVESAMRNRVASSFGVCAVCQSGFTAAIFLSVGPLAGSKEKECRAVVFRLGLQYVVAKSRSLA